MFTVRSRIFGSYGDVSTTGEGIQNLGLCSLLADFEREGKEVREGTRAMPTMRPRFFQSHPSPVTICRLLPRARGLDDLYSNLDPHATCLFSFG